MRVFGLGGLGKLEQQFCNKRNAYAVVGGTLVPSVCYHQLVIHMRHTCQ